MKTTACVYWSNVGPSLFAKRHFLLSKILYTCTVFPLGRAAEAEVASQLCVEQSHSLASSTNTTHIRTHSKNEDGCWTQGLGTKTDKLLDHDSISRGSTTKWQYKPLIILQFVCWLPLTAHWIAQQKHIRNHSAHMHVRSKYDWAQKTCPNTTQRGSNWHLIRRNTSPSANAKALRVSHSQASTRINHQCSRCGNYCSVVSTHTKKDIMKFHTSQISDT